jgi:hypothetical protein
VGIVEGKPELTHVVAALHPPSRLASALHGRKQQTDQHADDRNYDEQFDKSEAAARRDRATVSGVTVMDVRVCHDWRFLLRECGAAIGAEPAR